MSFQSHFEAFVACYPTGGAEWRVFKECQCFVACAPFVSSTEGNYSNGGVLRYDGAHYAKCILTTFLGNNWTRISNASDIAKIDISLCLFSYRVLSYNRILSINRISIAKITNFVSK